MASQQTPWVRRKPAGISDPCEGCPFPQKPQPEEEQGKHPGRQLAPQGPRNHRCREKPLHLPQVRSAAPTRGRGRQVGCAARLCVWLETRCLPRDPPQHQALLPYGPALKKLK